MPRLIFDIETTGQPLEDFDEVQQEYLLREAEKLPDEAGRAVKRDEILRTFSLWPFTGQVVSCPATHCQRPPRFTHTSV